MLRITRSSSLPLRERLSEGEYTDFTLTLTSPIEGEEFLLYSSWSLPRTLLRGWNDNEG